MYEHDEYRRSVDSVLRVYMSKWAEYAMMDMMSMQ